MTKSADIKVGYSCNNKCIHCVIDDKRQKVLNQGLKIDLTFNEYKQKIKESLEYDVQKIILTGGEPTIRKDFIDILDFLKSKNLCVELQTNGRKFKDIEFCNKTLEKIDEIVIPVLGSDFQIHDKITQANYSFEETIKGIGNLKEKDICLIGTIVILKQNKDDLLNILKLLNSLNVKNVLLTYPTINGKAEENRNEIIVKYSDVKNQIQDCIEYAIKNEMNIKLVSIPPCVLDKDYDKKYFSDLKKKSSGNILIQLGNDKIIERNEALYQDKVKIFQCNGCIYRILSMCCGINKKYFQVGNVQEFRTIKQIPENLKSIFKKQINNWK